jgi:hypothetical protein
LPSASPGKQRLELRTGGPLAQRLELGARVLERGLVVLGVGHVGELDGVIEFALQRTHRLHLAGKARALAHQGLGVAGVIP